MPDLLHFPVRPPDAAMLDPRFARLLDGRYRLLSFDLFDTLFIRTHHRPDELFTLIGERAMGRGLLDPGLTPHLFRALRLEAARRADLRHGAEFSQLRHIYEEMPEALVQREAVMAVELEIESEAIRANGLLTPLLARLHDLRQASDMTPDIKVVALSDTYLDHNQLVWLMRRAGISPAWFDAILASCEVGTTKRTGGLFRHLIALYPDILPSTMCHVGDDYLSDLLGGRQAGMGVVDYSVPASFTAIMEREQMVLGTRRDGLWHDPARRLAARLPVPSETNPLMIHGGAGPAFWHQIGAVILGPVLVRYALWIVDECRKLGIDHIVVLMREGRLLAPLIRACATSRGYKMTVKPLFTSRQAMGRSELPRWDRDGLVDLLERRPYLRLRDLLAQGGAPVPPERFSAFADHHLEELVTQHLDDGKLLLEHVADWFAEPETARAIAKATEQARALTIGYLLQEFSGTKAVALVDLGSRATTAAAIHRLMPEREAHALRAFLLYATEPVTGVIAEGLPISVHSGCDEQGLAHGRLLYRSPFPIERLLTGLDDCTIGYRKQDDGRIVPVFDPTAAQGAEETAILAVESGIRGCWACYMATGLPSPEALPASPFLPWLALLQLPTAEEARALGSLRYDYNDGSKWVREICDETALQTVHPLLADYAGPLQARLFGSRPQQVPWPQGAATCIEPDVIRRHHDALSSDPGHLAFCSAMVRRMTSAGIRQTLLFAAGGHGGMGAAFITAARHADLEVVAYLDHLPQMVDDLFCGVPVLRVEQLATAMATARQGPLAVAIVSLGYQEKILTTVRLNISAADLLIYGLFDNLSS